MDKIKLLLTVIIICILVFILWYIFAFDWICSKMNISNWLTQIWNCKDSLICKISDIKIENNIIKSWKCEKNTFKF
jgi:hypothetical protein